MRFEQNSDFSTAIEVDDQNNLLVNLSSYTIKAALKKHSKKVLTGMLLLNVLHKIH